MVGRSRSMGALAGHCRLRESRGARRDPDATGADRCGGRLSAVHAARRDRRTDRSGARCERHGAVLAEADLRHERLPRLRQDHRGLPLHPGPRRGAHPGSEKARGLGHDARELRRNLVLARAALPVSLTQGQFDGPDHGHDVVQLPVRRVRFVSSRRRASRVRPGRQALRPHDGRPGEWIGRGRRKRPRRRLLPSALERVGCSRGRLSAVPHAGYDMATRNAQIAQENYRWAATAGADVASVTGSVKDGQIPKVRYDRSRFDAEGRLGARIVREPRNEACLSCHAKPGWKKRGANFRARTDVHLRAG